MTAQRWVPTTLGLDQFGGVVGEPEPVQGVAVEGEDDDRPSRHAPHLVQAGFHVGPLVDGQRGHGRVEGLVVEGEVLGHAVKGGNGVGRSLRPHRGRRLEGHHVPVGGLVRS